MPNEERWILAGLAGALLGAWWTNEQYHRDTVSRAEIDDPDGLNEARKEITELIDDFEIEGKIESEDEFRDILAEYLTEHSEFEIEVAPDTPHGKPDILVGGLLALEIKYAPLKAELDRSVGQCARYSREWDTWIVLVDCPASRVTDFEELLEDRGLGFMPVLTYQAE